MGKKESSKVACIKLQKDPPQNLVCGTSWEWGMLIFFLCLILFKASSKSGDTWEERDGLSVPQMLSVTTAKLYHWC